jgi:hypothetical protein
MADFSPNGEMQKVAPLVQELFENVLYDEEPLFVSDEANTLGSFDVGCRRCFAAYS